MMDNILCPCPANLVTPNRNDLILWSEVFPRTMCIQILFVVSPNFLTDLTTKAMDHSITRCGWKTDFASIDCKKLKYRLCVHDIWIILNELIVLTIYLGIFLCYIALHCEERIAFVERVMFYAIICELVCQLYRFERPNSADRILHTPQSAHSQSTRTVTNLLCHFSMVLFSVRFPLYHCQRAINGNHFRFVCTHLNGCRLLKLHVSLPLSA